eukprot:321495_1
MNQTETIDTSIFQTNKQKCNGFNDCSSVKRIMTALTYYNKILSQNTQKFIDFRDKYYSKNYLRDYIHFIDVHKNDINKDETKTETCPMVSSCVSTRRHYRDRNTNEDIKNDENINEIPHLYVDI